MPHQPPVDDETLRQALTAIPDRVFILDLDGRIIHANRAEAGGRPDDALSPSIFDYVPSDSEDAHRELLQRVIQTGEPGEHEGVAMGADGRPGWYRSRIVPLRKDGEIRILVSIARDITERRQAERERARSEAVLEAVNFAARLFLQSPDWERRVDAVLARLGEATEVSRAYLFETRTGSDGRPLVSQRFEWAAPHADPELENPEMQDLDLTAAGFGRWVQRFQAGKMVQGSVAEFPKSEQPHLSEQSIHSMAIVPIFVGEEWWGCLGFDDCRHAREWSVAEQEVLQAAASTVGGAIRRERAEAGVRASERHYRRLVQTAPYAVYAVDTENRLTELNRAGEELVGRPADQVLGRRFDELFAMEDLPPAEAAYRKVAQGEIETLEVELRIQRPSGEKRDIHLAATPIREEGKLTGVHGIARDITEERARDEHLRRAERLASLGTLVGGVAHELNNPLTSIRGLVQLLMDDTRSEDEMEMLRTVAREAERSSQIVNNLRRLTRQSRTSADSVHRVDLNDVVRHVLTVRKYALRIHNIEVSLDLADGLHPVVGDRGQVEQILLNLVVNAEQALETVDRERRIIVRTKAARRGVTLSVYDNGPGIPSVHLDRLFDPFWTTKDPDKGTGLGLSLVHSIVREHGGEIDVQSEVGRGALFLVHLPATERREMEPPSTPSESPPFEPTGSRALRILAVDDEEGIREVLDRLLTREGHHVELAADGAEALERIAAADGLFHLIISDLRMPGIGGEEFRRQLLEQAPEYAGRIVFMTGDVTAREVGRIMGETRMPMVRKPFDLSEILELVRSHGRTLEAPGGQGSLGRRGDDGMDGPQEEGGISSGAGQPGA